MQYTKYSKMLSDDTHIAYDQKRQWDMMPSESTQKMLPDDTYIVLLPKMAMGHDAIIAMQ